MLDVSATYAIALACALWYQSELVTSSSLPIAETSSITGDLPTASKCNLTLLQELKVAKLVRDHVSSSGQENRCVRELCSLASIFGKIDSFFSNLVK